ncbi:MAG: helix-turn-helix transcriptional regulator [Lawsonibacter sp.]|jgi:transcriptional regulator with XRE-family HTH domain|nr:helix-turn-helix transcriptional regulator [Lawsonibacter sp.]
MKLSKKLVSLRKKKRLSQMELAEMLQVSRQAISKWETGKAVPSIENLKCLSELYQISMDDLISSEETIQMTDCISTINEESMKSKENKKKEDWNTKKLSIIFVSIIIGIFLLGRWANATMVAMIVIYLFLFTAIIFILIAIIKKGRTGNNRT